MTYLSAARLAEQAENHATTATMRSGDDTSDKHLAQAIADLSAAVADLCKTMQEDQD